MHMDESRLVLIWNCKLIPSVNGSHTAHIVHLSIEDFNLAYSIKFTRYELFFPASLAYLCALCS